MRIWPLFGLWVTLAAAAPGPARASQREAGPRPSASIFATVGHSEWCPAGQVRLNLATGRYTVTAPRTWRTCRMPAFPRRVRTDVLAAADLIAVRAAYYGALSDGLEHPGCRGEGRRPLPVVSNGGLPSLRLANRARTISAPKEMHCWSAAARRLHRMLEDLFAPRSYGDR